MPFEDGYRTMAADNEREAEAMEWCNAIASDMADELQLLDALAPPPNPEIATSLRSSRRRRLYENPAVSLLCGGFAYRFGSKR